MWNDSSRYLALSVVLAVTALGCSGSSPTEPTPAPCTYTLSASSLSFGASGGSNSVTVTAASHCTWTATSDRGWMSITSGASGSGGGTVNVAVSSNPTDTVRTGTLTIAGLAVPVREDGFQACTLDISPSSASFNKDDATGSFAVSAPGSCPWTAMSNLTWLRVTAGSPGLGNGSVSYSVERNRDVTSRTGAIAVGERTFTVTQAGDTPNCEYSVAPVELTPCMSVSYTLTTTITTQQGCTWTANPDASWITLDSGQSGSGSGTVSFRVSDNWDAPRQGVVMVRWPTPTAGQNVRVLQAGCLYAVSTTAVSVGAAGGPGTFDVYQESFPNTCGGPLQNACRWSAQSDVPWITITTTMPQAGDNRVSFTVAANDSTSARSGTITVRDKVVRVTQAGR
jgi:hypothetical protein